MTDALTELVRAHQVGVWRQLRSLGSSQADADALTVDVFALAHEKGIVARDPRETAAWLGRTARYLWLEQQRRHRRDAEHFAAAARDLWERDCPDGGDDAVEALRGCIAQLDGRAAEAIRLCYEEELPRDRAAALLGLASNGLKTLLQRVPAYLAEGDVAHRTRRFGPGLGRRGRRPTARSAAAHGARPALRAGSRAPRWR